MLAASHAVGVNALIEEEVATFLAELLLQRYPQFLTTRYGIQTAGIDAVAVIEGVAKKRAYKLKGGEWDYEKAAHTLLLDYRSGALGRVSLETPQSREHLIATYVPPVLLGQGKNVDTGMQAEDKADSESHE
jgi:ribosome biogenesis GTPase A